MTDTRTTILKVSTQLFAAKGYDGVSMRNIADEVKISAPALYNHFKDKRSLYLTAISEAFEEKSEQYIRVIEGSGTPLERLEHMVQLQCKLLHEDPDFHRLIQRELLDGDKSRLEYLVQEVFACAHRCFSQLLKEIRPDSDADTLVIFIIGMIHKTFDLQSSLQFLPNSRPEQSEPSYISQQVMAILTPYLEVQNEDNH